MEPQYVLFRTAGGCLLGLAGFILYFALGIMALIYVSRPVWVRVALLVAMGFPIMLPVFLVDRRGSRSVPSCRSTKAMLTARSPRRQNRNGGRSLRRRAGDRLD
jgi:hypothetical protein